MFTMYLAHGSVLLTALLIVLTIIGGYTSVKVLCRLQEWLDLSGGAVSRLDHQQDNH